MLPLVLFHGPFLFFQVKAEGLDIPVIHDLQCLLSDY